MAQPPPPSPPGDGYRRSFDRYELKYVVEHARVEALMARAAPYLTPDPQAGAGGRYQVASLYYDSPDLTAYWEKLDGVAYRRKVRLRVYPGRDPDVGFLEVKERFRRSVRKRRVRASVAELYDFLATAGRRAPPTLWEALGLVGEEAALLTQELQLRPRVVTLYSREPWFGRFESGVRLTIDRELRHRRHVGRFAYDLARDPLLLPSRLAVVEVKCNDLVPSWLCSALAACDMESRRFSKYCHAVDRQLGERTLSI